MKIHLRGLYFTETPFGVSVPQIFCLRGCCLTRPLIEGLVAAVFYPPFRSSGQRSNLSLI